MVVYRCSPANLLKLKRFWQQEWDKFPKQTCAKLEEITRRLEASSAAKSVLAKYKVQGLNICTEMTFQYCILDTFRE